MKEFKVAIMGIMPASGYSGGRYHAWIMAEALAYSKNQVYFITNNIPKFSNDFEQYPTHNDIHIILVNDFYEVSFEQNGLDYVICVPAIGQGKRFYYACLDFAIKKGARFAFINFETPNWYRACSEIVRSERDYIILQKICKHGCLIFSSANESQKYAKEYYGDFSGRTEYCVWSPPINSVTADSVKEDKRNQILIFLRIKDKHKGGDDFLQFLGEYLRGMTCICVVGIGDIAKDFLAEAQAKADQYGIELIFEKSLSDYRKFQEMKRSKLLLFPSHFEGYGYPPVEALYCGTKCIVYDLPVLREISGHALTYCEMGNISMMKEEAGKLLKEADIEPICVDTAEFTRQAERLQCILEDNFENSKLTYKRRIGYGIVSAARKWHYTHIKIFMPEIIKSCIDSKTVISRYLDNNNEKWEVVKREIKGKKVYIWGCGNAYQALYPKYKKRIRLQGILDSNPDKVGTKDAMSGEMIIQSPEILKSEDRELIVVLISNKDNVDTIIEELRRLKVKYYHSLCMIEANSLESKIYKSLTRKR